MLNQAITKRLEELREEWKKYPERRKTIELQAKILKLAFDVENKTITEEKANYELQKRIIDTLI